MTLSGSHRGGFYIFPELSNSGSLPGKAGGLPRLITINESSIIIKKVFKNIEIKWPEVVEVKKQEKGFGVWAGWRYSLKYVRDGEKEIVFADRGIGDLPILIYFIFRLAISAKFTEIINEAVLPFFKKYRISEWKNN